MVPNMYIGSVSRFDNVLIPHIHNFRNKYRFSYPKMSNLIFKSSFCKPLHLTGHSRIRSKPVESNV